MNISFVTKAFLVISGILGIAIGGALLFAPVAFQASIGINLGDNINLLSETRAPGGLLLAAGFLIASGAFFREMTQTSLMVSGLVYLSYGVSV